MLFASEGASAVLVDLAQDAVRLETRPCGDLTRNLGGALFDNVDLPATRLLDGMDAGALADDLMTHASLAVANDSAGRSNEIFDLTIEYLIEPSDRSRRSSVGARA